MLQVRVKDSIVHWGVEDCLADFEVGAAREKEEAKRARRRGWKCMVGIWRCRWMVGLKEGVWKKVSELFTFSYSMGRTAAFISLQAASRAESCPLPGIHERLRCWQWERPLSGFNRSRLCYTLCTHPTNRVASTKSTTPKTFRRTSSILTLFPLQAIGRKASSSQV